MLYINNKTSCEHVHVTSSTGLRGRGCGAAPAPPPPGGCTPWWRTPCPPPWPPWYRPRTPWCPPHPWSLFLTSFRSSYDPSIVIYVVVFMSSLNFFGFIVKLYSVTSNAFKFLRLTLTVVLTTPNFSAGLNKFLVLKIWI